MKAYGIDLASPEIKIERTILKQFDENAIDALDKLFVDMERKLLNDSSFSDHEYEKRYEIDIRPSGTESYLTIEYINYEKRGSSYSNPENQR